MHHGLHLCCLVRLSVCSYISIHALPVGDGDTRGGHDTACPPVMQKPYGVSRTLPGTQSEDATSAISGVVAQPPIFLCPC